jgi:hypothetical protein
MKQNETVLYESLRPAIFLLFCFPVVSHVQEESVTAENAVVMK